MKANLAKLFIISALATIGTPASSESNIDHELFGRMETSEPTPVMDTRETAMYGHEGAGSSVIRTVNITPTSKYLNVANGETIRINAGDKSVLWTFDANPRGPFPLAKIIGGESKTMVYVSANPLYSGGGE